MRYGGGKLTLNGLGGEGTTVGNNGGLGEDVLLEESTETVVNGDLDLLNNKDDSGDILELISEVALAEDVVQVVLEAEVLVLDDEDVLCLLNNGLLEAVVDDLKVLLLELEHLLLVVEVVEAIGEVEVVVATETAIEANSTE